MLPNQISRNRIRSRLDPKKIFLTAFIYQFHRKAEHASILVVTLINNDVDKFINFSQYKTFVTFVFFIILSECDRTLLRSGDRVVSSSPSYSLTPLIPRLFKIARSPIPTQRPVIDDPSVHRAARAREPSWFWLRLPAICMTFDPSPTRAQCPVLWCSIRVHLPCRLVHPL